ncbi:MAG: tRNA (adenosine(37)-N6)-threonylcarbamoyltransferase complex dimerization subunit type 1 TsaB [Oscillospiraceae bacterium]|nr:tRNA (adenosine(37)-N6)-threonylcarbamoyltransferase complex dimerization subunit type 1 TsaB [Oscillospiraceae bacterium]
MIVLGVESSAVSVSVAVLKDKKLLCELFANNGLTHSVTLLPQIKLALDTCSLSPQDVDVFAVSSGPGSFTGLRIGAATVKGLAANGAACLGVSTLEAMAYSHCEFNGVICTCMDARCSQVYNALFKGGEIQRLCDDRAVMIEELASELKEISQNVLLVGDGANLVYKYLTENCPELLGRVSLAPEGSVYQRANGVCAAAFARLEKGESAVGAEELNLEYLRLPQAERELKKKEILK